MSNAEFIKEYGNKCKYEKKDTLLYTSKECEVKEMKEEYEIRKNAGIDVKYISEENNPFSLDLNAGVYGVNAGAQLDPYEYTHQLLDVSCNMGLKVYENTEVMDIAYGKDKVEITTSFGYKVKAKKVIIATGYNTQRFTKRNFGVKTVTYNIATKSVKSFDGWFNIIHLVLPTYEWFDREVSKSEGSALGLYDLIYFSDGINVYKYIEGKVS